MSGGGNTYHLHFGNYVGDKRDLMEVVRTELIRADKRNGGGGRVLGIT